MKNLFSNGPRGSKTLKVHKLDGLKWLKNISMICVTITLIVFAKPKENGEQNIIVYNLNSSKQPTEFCTLYDFQLDSRNSFDQTLKSCYTCSAHFN